MKKIIALLLGLLLCLSLGACSSEEEENREENEVVFSYDDLDLSAMVDEIYKNIEVSELTAKSVSKVTDKTTLDEQYYLDLSKVVAYEVRSASGQYGVCDVAILRVKDGAGNEVAESLEKRKDDRINEFLNYDVYNSYSVAMEAEIYQEGELVIMLMLSKEDISAAKEIIDSYLV